SSDGSGGIVNAGTATLTNCTLADNSGSSGGGIGNGGALTLTNCTVAGNSGGGICADGSANAALTVANTIIAGNTGGDGVGGVDSRGHNLVGDPSGSSGFDASLCDRLGMDPLLEPLQDNGGPTFTMALLPGSPARGAGDVARAVDASDSPLATDQRGFAR